MKKLLIILSFVALSGCDDSNEAEEQFFNLYSGLEFSIFNSQNEDLLNPEHPNHINTEAIKVFYVINGERQEVYNGNYDNPRNFKVYKHENEYRLGLSLNHTETSDKPVTYIQWSEDDTDIIEASFERSQNAIMQKKIWLNGELIWELGNNTIDPYFVLAK